MKFGKWLVSSVDVPIILGGIILTFSGLIPGRMLYWGTASLQFIPWRSLALTQISQGILPIWNSLNGMGAPLLANYQMAFFYPPGWLSFLFGWLGGDPWMIWSLDVLLTAHIIWAGIGMARLVRRLGINEIGQIVAGLAFSLSGYWIARGSFFSMIWAGSWLPWLILSVSEISNPVDGVQTQKRVPPYFFIICMTMQLLAGHAQLTWYSILLACIWVGIGFLQTRNYKVNLIGLGRLAVGGALAAGIAAIQLIPTAEYLVNSPRANAYGFERAMVYSFWPWRILTFFAPNLFGSPGLGNYWGYASYWEDAVYIGLFPLLLALFTLGGLFRKRKHSECRRYHALTTFCWIVLIVGIILSLGDNTPIFPWLYKNMPTFDMFQAPTRWNLWSVFALTLLSGYQAGKLKRPFGNRKRKIQMLAVSAIAVIIGALAAIILLPEIKKTFSSGFLILGVLCLIAGILLLKVPEGEFQKEIRWRWIIVAVIVVDLLFANWGVNPTIKITEFINFSHPLSTVIQASKSRIYLPSEDEYLLKFKRFLRFENYQWIEEPSLYVNAMLPNLNILQNLSSANNFDPLIPARYAEFISWMESLSLGEKTKVMELANIGWIEKRVVNTREGVLFERLEPEEIAQWKSCATYVETPEAAIDELRNIIKLEETSSTIVIESKDKEELSVFCSPSEASLLIRSENNIIIIKSSSETQGWIFLANTWYPGWTVSVDGIEKTNYHANYLFQAVEVDAGQHVIVWKYQPRSLYWGWVICGLSFIFMLIWTLLVRKKVQTTRERTGNE